jgi:hypothetical protein
MAALIREVEVGSEKAIVLPGATLVASASCPGTWHQVVNGACDCKGFIYRSTCRHLAVAAIAQEQQLAAVEWDAVRGAWAVRWAGYRHGGIHRHLEDALDHVESCNEMGPGQARLWVELHAREGEQWQG